MVAIKFSHQYVKFPLSFDSTYLMDVEVVNLEDLDPAFLEADTAIVGGGHYPLPKRGKYMILWLKSDPHPEWNASTPGGWCKFMANWQTIRRWTATKETYYRRHIGERVRIEVEHEPD